MAFLYSINEAVTCWISTTNFAVHTQPKNFGAKFQELKTETTAFTHSTQKILVFTDSSHGYYGRWPPSSAEPSCVCAVYSCLGTVHASTVNCAFVAKRRHLVLPNPNVEK